MDTTRLVTIRPYANEVDAEIARQHLESHSVEAFVRKDDCMRPWLQGIQGVFLEVLDSDKENAENILNAMDS